MSGPLHVIWDLDGTLINSENEVMEALVRSVREAGLSENLQKAPFRVGPTIDKMLDNAFDASVLSPEKKTQVISLFRRNYDNCGFNNTPAFAGVEDILNDSRFVHHIVTNKPDLATGRILEKLGWEKKFASVITPYSFMKSPDDKKKSKQELFALCMNSCPDARFVGVGDMDTDAVSAHLAGIKAIGVLWGTGTKEELQAAGCDEIAENMAALKNLLAAFAARLG